MFYVYCLYRPWDMTPCYVGKGKGRRIRVHFQLGENHRNPHLANIIKKAGGELPHKIMLETKGEQEAFAEEIRLIALYGRADLNMGPLCNLTDGGEGPTGRIRPESEKARISATMQQILASMTPEERRARAANTDHTAAIEANQKRFREMGEEEKRAFADRCSANMTAFLNTLSPDEKKSRMAAAWAEFQSLTPGERKARMAPARAAAGPALRALHAEMGAEEKAAWAATASANMKAYCATLTMEQKQKRAAASNVRFVDATPEQKRAMMEKTHKARNAAYAALTDEQKAERRAKIMAGQKAYWDRKRADKLGKLQHGG